MQTGWALPAADIKPLDQPIFNLKHVTDHLISEKISVEVPRSPGCAYTFRGIDCSGRHRYASVPKGNSPSRSLVALATCTSSKFLVPCPRELDGLRPI